MASVLRLLRCILETNRNKPEVRVTGVSGNISMKKEKQEKQTEAVLCCT